LAYLRDSVKDIPGGFCIAFTQSLKFKSGADHLLTKHPDFQLELGLMYLSDSLAKNEIRSSAKTDVEIAASDAEVHRLNSELGQD
jgi:hypothetical protein